MKKDTVRAIMATISHLARTKELESDEHSALKKAVPELQHALNIKDIHLIEKAVSKIATLLVRKGVHQP